MDDEIAHAFENGDYKRALELLQKVRDPNNIDLLGFYPDKYEHIDCNTYKVSLLHLAAYHGWLDICHQLITEYKYNPHVQNSCRSLTVYSTCSNFLNDLPPPPPLSYATLGGHYEVVTYLINKCNCDPHQQSEHGETPLYLACLAGHYGIVTYLISTCHCVNTQDDYGYNLLHIACRYGELGIMTFLLSLSSSDVNIQSYSGYTPLHTACHYGQLDIIKFLVFLPSVDLNIQDNSGYTLIHTACECGKLEILKFLISLPSVDINIQDYSGNNLLNTTCRYGQLDIIKFLVSLTSVDVNTKGGSGNTPLHTACQYGHLNIIKFLVSLPLVDVNIQDGDDYTPLHTACQYGQLDIVKFLVSLPIVDGNIQDGDDYTPLHTACQYGELDIVKVLVSLPSVDVNIQGMYGYTPLCTACRYGQLDIIKFLVSLPSVDVNIQDGDGYTPLYTACRYSQLDIIKFLTSLPSVDVNIQDNSGSTPLKTACEYGQLDIVKFLTSLPSVDMNIQDYRGNNLLKTTCRCGHLDVVKFLVSLPSVDLNIQSNSTYTPLHIACRYSQLNIIKFLTSLPSVDVNIQSNSGYSPIHTACEYGQLQIIKFLMSLPSLDVNIQSKNGYSPMHTACRYSQLDIVKFVASSPSIDVNIRDNSGYTPLHTACEYGKLDIIKFLISLPSVDMNIQDYSGNNLLNTTCRYGQVDVIKFLVSLTSVDVNTKGGSGYTPLHIACRFGKLDVIKFLVSLPAVDVNIQSNSDYTPLHTACEYGHLQVIKFLASLPSIVVNIQSNNGYTPLHTACRYGQLDVIKSLVSLPSVDVNIQSNSGYTPLHTACKYGQLQVIKFLVSLPSVDVNFQSYSGYTPLHTACRYGQLDIITCLVSLPSVDVNITDHSGYTLLHKSCRYGQLDIINFLLTLSSIDANIRIPSYPVLLHKACRNGTLDVVLFLVSSSSVDVNAKDDNGYTPLHTACHHGKLDIVKFLMSTEGINPISTDKNGNTPLHIACSNHEVDIVTYLLSTGHTNPMSKNSQLRTPVQMAGHNYSILKLFEPFEQCKVDFPVESYSKVFLCGNTTNGKSSLAHTLLQRVSISWRVKYNPFKRQEKAEPLTAGIVPHHLESNETGNIVLYDLAGHPEYYSSHEAVLATLMLRSPAVFIILVKLTDAVEDIKMQLYYWANFIKNACGRMSKKSQVIIVGSHADNRRGAENAKAMVDNCEFEQIFQQLEYKGFVAMDCRNQKKTGFDQFITHLSESSQAVVDRSDSISFYCHVLYAFLKTKLGQVAITSEVLLQKIQDENEPSLPSNEPVLFELLTTLSDKGLILFIKSTVASLRSWVVIDKQSLLKELNGTLFAPSHLKEYRANLASNTGIVPVSILQEVFPHYKVDMLVGFLKSLEFCHEIDKDTHKIITTNISSSQGSEKLLYFPALVSVEPSSAVTITDGFGWCLWCPNPYQFLSTRFLHVLLLKLAYTFSSKVSGGGIIQSNSIQPFDRSCTVWKNGICWTRDGVKIVVQVSELNRSVILLAQPNNGMEYCESHSSVIKKIIEVKNEFCICPDTKEFLISPHQLHTTLQCNLADLSLYEVQDIARALLLKKKSITNDKSETLDISSLLKQFEPYHFLSLSVIQQLFDDSKVSQCIPEHLLKEIQERCRPIMDIYPVTRESSTYQSVRDHLNRFSIFGGRNPFDIADPVLTDDERKMISQSFSVTTNVKPLGNRIPGDTLGSSQYSVPVSKKNLTTLSCDVARDSTTPLTIFTRHVNEMLGVISDPDTERLSNDLTSTNLIPYSIKDDLISTKGLSRYQKASKLLNEIERSLRNLNTPEILEKFCVVLKKQENPALKRMAGEMLKELGSIQDGIGLVSSRNLTTDLKSPLNIFVRHMCEMLHVISDPDTERLPNDLSSANLIPYSMKDDFISTKGLSHYQKASILLNEIHRLLRYTNKPEILENFSEVLTKQDNPALTRIAEHMLKELDSCQS